MDITALFEVSQCFSLSYNILCPEKINLKFPKIDFNPLSTHNQTKLFIIREREREKDRERRER